MGRENYMQSAIFPACKCLRKRRISFIRHRVSQDVQWFYMTQNSNGSDKENQENARNNYLEAGKSANQLLIPVLIAVLGPTIASPDLLYPAALILFLSIISLIIHKMRQMCFFMDEKNGGKQYEERERFIKNIPCFLFSFYLLVILTFVFLSYTILTMNEDQKDFKPERRNSPTHERDFKPNKSAPNTTPPTPSPQPKPKESQ